MKNNFSNLCDFFSFKYFNLPPVSVTGAKLRAPWNPWNIKVLWWLGVWGRSSFGTKISVYAQTIKLTLAVRETSVSRHNGWPLKGPLIRTLLNKIKAINILIGFSMVCDKNLLKLIHEYDPNTSRVPSVIHEFGTLFQSSRRRAAPCAAFHGVASTAHSAYQSSYK